MGSGTGADGGIGPDSGSGIGPGKPGGFGNGAARPGRGVTAPIPIYRPDPEYSDEARKSKFEGTVRLEIVVDERGNPSQLRVLRALGLGLVEKALEAVRKWHFRPGTQDGRPVPVVAFIDVNFRLL